MKLCDRAQYLKTNPNFWRGVAYFSFTFSTMHFIAFQMWGVLIVFLIAATAAEALATQARRRLGKERSAINNQDEP
jgi:hypothetical protein